MKLLYWMIAALTPVSLTLDALGSSVSIGTNYSLRQTLRYFDAAPLGFDKLTNDLAKAISEGEGPKERLGAWEAFLLTRLGYTGYYERVETLLVPHPDYPGAINIGVTYLQHLGDARAARNLGTILFREDPEWWAGVQARFKREHIGTYAEGGAQGLSYMAETGTLPKLGTFPAAGTDIEGWRRWWREHGDQALAIMEAREGKARVTNTAPHAAPAFPPALPSAPTPAPEAVPPPSVTSPESPLSWWTLALIAIPALAAVAWLAFTCRRT